ncbi:MAG: pseudouridine synthase, partial [Lachnospiraceae bacterium]|nr:pseudouridine synthase [Lachnospiraceae bacterium]
DEHAEVTVKEAIDYPVPLHYAGRLDKDTEGLLLLTNDGDLIDALMRGINGHEKEYIVKVQGRITDDALDQLRSGIYLEELDVTTRPCKVERLGDKKLRIILTQGLNRQIKRMCNAVGLKVIALKRIRVANIRLGDLKPGQYRELNSKEIEQLYALKSN